MFKRIRQSISTLFKRFNAQSLDAAGQSILTFQFNTVLPREVTCIQQKQSSVAVCAHEI